MKERLQKFIARRGLCSRRAAERLIADGRVSVNDQVITALGTQIDPAADRITVDDEPLPAERPSRTLMLHKPIGYLSTCSPGRERGPTVLDLVPGDRRYYPVGRLDRDSSGLLLLTDDGKLAYRLTHPKFGSEKSYVVTTKPALSEAQIRKLQSGVDLDDGPARALRARAVRGGVELTLAEGRNRQVRRMIESLGARVIRLHRRAVSGLRLGDLPVGRWRRLTDDELSQIERTLGCSTPSGE